MTPLLQIMIPTIVGREAQFARLANHLLPLCAGKPVELYTHCDNKELSIGSKRQQLLDAVTAPYFVMIDDDDMVPPEYVDEVLNAIGEWRSAAGILGTVGLVPKRPDCITYRESVRIDGRESSCNHSIKYNDWGTNQDGYDYVRTPYYKDVLRTELARQVGFKDMRYGEDHDFARRLRQLLKTEVHIDKVLYYYFGSSLNNKQHKQRYGIR